MLTVFASQFLDKQRAFPEFVGVLKPGGYLGVNEMYKADEIPPEAVGDVREGEQIFQELTGLPFTLNSPKEWRQALEKAAFVEIIIEEYPNLRRQGNSLKMVNEFRGLGRLARTLVEMLLLAARSSEIRSRFGKISKGKQLLLRGKMASKYIGYILVVGKKP